ncbi:MAG: carboxypeptidase-like regulatory domain-containing protein [Terriglobia bacterium]
MRIAMLLLAALLAPLSIGAGQSVQSPQTESPASKGAAHITVSVADVTGAVIPYALVKYQRSSEIFGHKTQTDRYGRALLELLPGSYDIAVTSSGFGTWHRGLEVEGAEEQAISFALEMHECTQCVEIVPAYSAAQPPPGRIPFSIELWTPKNRDVVKAGQEIRVTATASMFRDLSFAETTRGPRTVYTVQVRDANGGTPPESDYLKTAEGVNAGGTTSDTPDGKRWWIPVVAHAVDYFTEDIDLSALFDLRKPGKYSVRVSRFDGETKTWVTSNTISLTVTP